MAGYLISLSDEESLNTLVSAGLYSTHMASPSNNQWMAFHEGTFADYLSMKEGDYIFFFVKRKIYGCGILVNIGDDCKYFNYTDAGVPSGHKSKNYSDTHLLPNGAKENRCFCTFEPCPAFFKHGVDMDEVLQNKDNPFRSIRTFWKLSFIKMDDDESQALYNVIMKSNEEVIGDKREHYAFDKSKQKKIARLVSYKYLMQRQFLIQSCRSNDRLKHEMALEASMCEMLTKEDIEPFGHWDYVSHQVIASPFKPIDYMDKMDIFGYKYIQGYKQYKIKSKYLIAELKKDEATVDIVEQIMKYVDWVSNEYANKDYSMIEAYIVAADFSDEVKELAREHCVRNFTKGYRPTEFCVWKALKMVKYKVDDEDVHFSLVSY